MKALCKLSHCPRLHPRNAFWDDSGGFLALRVWGAPALPGLGERRLWGRGKGKALMLREVFFLDSGTSKFSWEGGGEGGLWAQPASGSVHGEGGTRTPASYPGRLWSVLTGPGTRPNTRKTAACGLLFSALKTVPFLP